MGKTPTTKIPITILRQQIIEFLQALPNVHESSGREALLYQAGVDKQILDQMRWNDPSNQFFPALVKTLWDYGTLHDGRHPLEAVLGVAKTLVGQEKKNSCETLTQQLRDDISTRKSFQVKTELKTLGVKSSTVSANNEEEPQERTDGDTHIGEVSGNVDIKQAGRDLVGGDKVGSDKINTTVGNVSGSGQIAFGKEIHQTTVHQHFFLQTKTIALLMLVVFIGGIVGITYFVVKPTISLTGNQNINKYNISKEQFDQLQKELDVTKGALTIFFYIIGKKNVPPENLRNTLEEIAKNYKELLQHLEIIKFDNPVVQDLKSQARQAIESGEFEKAEIILNKASAIDSEAIDQLDIIIQQGKQAERTKEKRQLSQAKINASNGQLQLMQLHNAKAAEYYQKAVNLVPDGHDELLAEYLYNTGYALHLADKYKQAMPLYEQALEIFKRMYGENHLEVAKLLTNIGTLWSLLESHQKAIELYEQALAIQKQVYGETHPQVAAVLSNLGTTYWSLNEHQKAIAYYEQALEIQKQVCPKCGEEHPDVAKTLIGIGNVWRSLGVYLQAIRLYEQALAIQKQVYGEENPEVVDTLTNLGITWYLLEEYQQAIALYEQALAIQKQVYGETHSKMAGVLINLGTAYWSLNEHLQAIKLYEQTLVIQRQEYGEEHPEVANTLSNLGSVWEASGKHQQAIESYEQALKIFRRVYGEEHPEVANTLSNLGSVWEALGKHQKSIAYYELAEHIFVEKLGEDHPRTIIIRAIIKLIKDDI